VTQINVSKQKTHVYFFFNKQILEQQMVNTWLSIENL